MPDLATSLNNLGKMYSDLGQRSETLKATERALDIYEKLAQSNPDAFLPDLAMSLNNLALNCN
ncbi:MAG: tetratricopeptide repeat protein [Deinococcales bacterium]